MKGGVAAMAIALKLLKDLDIKLSVNLIFNAVADEETGGKFGTRWCLNFTKIDRFFKKELKVLINF